MQFIHYTHLSSTPLGYFYPTPWFPILLHVSPSYFMAPRPISWLSQATWGQQIPQQIPVLPCHSSGVQVLWHSGAECHLGCRWGCRLSPQHQQAVPPGIEANVFHRASSWSLRKGGKHTLHLSLYILSFIISSPKIIIFLSCVFLL